MLDAWGSDFSALGGWSPWLQTREKSQGSQAPDERRGGICEVCRKELEGLGLRKVKVLSEAAGWWRPKATLLKSLAQLLPEAACAQLSIILTQIFLSFLK